MNKDIEEKGSRVNSIELPKILQVPEKLYPMIADINDYRYFLLSGGRGSGKTHGIARLILHMCEHSHIRVFCGREVQNTIDESVYTVFRDLIGEHNLNFEVFANKITHKKTKSSIRFKGFREQGMFNVKGLEGVSVLWIDEAQAITKSTLDVIIPTIRKEKAKVFFSMNRYLKNDAVYEQFSTRKDCLNIKINYMDNPFCSEALRVEAAVCKAKDDGDYEHIWLGEPLVAADDYLFTGAELEATPKVEFLQDKSAYGERILAADIARYGEDINVAIVLEQCGPEHWKELYIEKWAKKDLMETTGRIIDIKSRYKPSITVIDGDGLGAGVVDRLKEIKIDVIEFRGGFPCENDLDKAQFMNEKTRAYYKIKEMFQLGRLRIEHPLIIKDLENIRFEYHSKGIKRIMAKEKMKQKYNIKSPDYSDALMMAISEIHNIYKAIDNQRSKQPQYAITDYDIDGPIIKTRNPAYAITD